MNVNSTETKPLIGGEVEKPTSFCESRRSVCNHNSRLLLETISWIKGWTLATWIRLVLLLVVIAAIIVAIVVFRVQKYFPDVLVPSIHSSMSSFTHLFLHSLIFHPFIHFFHSFIHSFILFINTN